MHDHIIKVTSQQKITALCLLNLSAVFDTIDHSILTICLSSWFGLKGTVLFWLQSYLFSCSFSVNNNAILSATFPLLQGVSRGSVLGPLLFILYTTSLSSALLSVTHRLNTISMLMTLNCSFLSLLQTSSQNSSHLETTIDTVSTWMSANLLSLNQSKTEFLLIGLPKQLSKVSDAALSDAALLMPSNVTITPSDSARNLGDSRCHI